MDITFTEDNVKHTTSFDLIENAEGAQSGDIRLVKWKDGHYYEAKILSIGK